jgi:hypothetical protein
MKHIFASLLLAAALAGCSSPQPRDYAAEKPVFDLRTYFNGAVDGWGVVQDRSGKVTRRMKVEILASWQGDVGTLDERFTHSDGKTERRVWTIRKQGDRYTGTAHDVVGEATGQAAGNALHWTYVLAAQRDNGDSVNLDMDDWMWLLDEKTLANRTRFSKFGIGFGEVSFFFRKRD